VNIVFVATSKRGDAWSEEWQSDARYTVAFLRRNGLSVDFVYKPILTDLAALTQHVIGEPEIVFFDLEEENCEGVLDFIGLLRREWRKAHIVVGGVAATLAPAELLAACKEIDFVVVGEREQALLNAVRRLQAGEDISLAPGLWSREFRNAPSPWMHDLECLPDMADDGIREMIEGVPPEDRTGYIMGSRGCYFGCSFCSVAACNERICGPKWRGRTPKAIVDELEALIAKLEIRSFIFQDDCFFGPGRAGEERARQLAHEILRRRLNIHYFVCCTLHDIRRNTILPLVESGLSKIGLSIESLNQPSQTLFGKGIQVKNIYPTLELIETLRLPCEVNLIFLEPYMDFAAVRANLGLFEYLRQKTYITYSDAFPFNELRPQPWARISRLLRCDGLIGNVDGSCRFLHAGVGRLAAFVRRLRDEVGPIYKCSLPFFNEGIWTGYGPARRILSSYGRGLRDWVSLSVLPPIISRACDIIEEGGPSADAALVALEEKFRQKILRLRQCLRTALESATEAWPPNCHGGLRCESI
jgi:hypothetical protein